jgi:hypothetical protein
MHRTQKMMTMICLLFFLVSCGRQKVHPSPVPMSSAPEPNMLTVFIHGTRIFPKFTLQEAYYSPSGMVNVLDLDKSFKNVHRMADLLSQADPKRFSRKKFYAFGWSGDLSIEARKSAAYDLYAALQELIETHERMFGVRPGIRLITHSHGGNVALNLAAVKDPLHPLIIDELILLACPVQEATKHLINDRMFIKRYALCSKADLLQRIDPQGLCEDRACSFFSERYFTNYPRVVQAKIRRHGRNLFHLEFILCSFIRHLPEVLDIMDSWYAEIMDTDEQSQGWEIPVIDLRTRTIKISPCTRSALTRCK